MRQEDIIALTERCVAKTYRRYPVCFVKGRGARLWDVDGKEYLDFVAGLAVTNLGHSHPRVVEAIKRQAERIIHTSNLYHIEPQARLAELLCERSFADRVFFCNSGAEANEAAIKLVRRYFNLKGESRYKIITMESSFHGRTFFSMTATAQKKIHTGFGPLPEGFVYVPFNDIDALEAAIDEETAAIMVEPIQGEGGVNLPDEGYLERVRQICNREGILLIFDEVQTGIGRTGTLFAYEHFGVEPDVMTLAKALAGGVPIGAMLATEQVMGAFSPGTHASTFGGNHLATEVAIEVLSTLLEEGVLENCRRVGEYLLTGLASLKRDYPFVEDVRGRGLMVAMELSIDASPIVEECLKRCLLINATAGRVLRFLPPLIIEEADVDRMLAILRGVLDGFKKG